MYVSRSSAGAAQKHRMSSQEQQRAAQEQREAAQEHRISQEQPGGAALLLRHRNALRQWA